MVTSRSLASDCQGSEFCTEGTRINEELLVPFSLTASNRVVDLNLTLTTFATLGGRADFGQSAYLRLVGVPDDVSFTSSSGVFLANPVAIPAVPEPAAFGMLACGLLAVWRMKRGATGRLADR